MIININDLNVALNVLKSAGNPGIGLGPFVNTTQDKYTYIEWQYDPAVVLDVATRLGLVVVENDVVRLTDDGQTVAEMGGNRIDLNDNQIEYIATHCIFNNPNFSDFVDFLGLFLFNDHRQTLIYNVSEYPTPNIEVELFVQLGILSKNNTIFILDPKYSMYVDHVFDRVVTQKHLDEILAEQKAVGELAEHLSLEYEKTRLVKLGHVSESDAVVQISLTNVAAGYDIKSFTGQSITLKHDLFIEVKARKKNIHSFIMSANEVRVAKRLGKNYVVHFWSGLATRKPVAPTMVIYDPIATLSVEECPSCLSYLVTIAKGVDTKC